MKSPDKKVTLNDVAAHAGVSYQTVSRVVNDHPHVSAATRKRVNESIRVLNYSPNQAARSLVTNRSNTIAIIGFGTTQYGPSQMVSNITNHAKNSGYRVTLSGVHTLGFAEIKAAIDDVKGQLIDGIIMIAPVVSDVLRDMSNLVGDIPYVQIDTRPEPGVASVTIDQAYGTRLATEHVIKLGHRTIAEISGPLHWHGAQMRHESWLTTMTQNNLAIDLSTEGNWSAASGYAATEDLLAQSRAFTAIICANDQMALGAMAALSKAGLRVPQDVSIVGFDDIPEAAYFRPALTTIHQDFSALGAQSIDYLVSLIRDPATPLHQRTLYPDMIVRKSTQSVE